MFFLIKFSFVKIYFLNFDRNYSDKVFIELYTKTEEKLRKVLKNKKKVYSMYNYLKTLTLGIKINFS